MTHSEEYLKKVSKWYEDQLKVVVYSNYWHLENQAFIEHDCVWSILNSECREAIKAKFLFNTISRNMKTNTGEHPRMNSQWYCYDKDFYVLAEGNDYQDVEVAGFIEHYERELEDS